ncbi:MAG: sigma 54-interacting transcriptional regulator, partial [Candidatus Scalindua sp.]
RVLEQRSYERIGSNQTIKADFTFIVATHRSLAKTVSQGTFREDLFHRINVFPVTLPPLRERIEDIPLLANHFLDYFRKELGKPLPGITKKALDALMKYSWPGNIRELKNCIERAAILANNELIKPEQLSFGEYHIVDVPFQEKEMHPTKANTVNFNFSLLKEEVSLDNIVEKAKAIVLEYCDNEKTRAAKLLKRDRNIFYRKK